MSTIDRRDRRRERPRSIPRNTARNPRNVRRFDDDDLPPRRRVVRIEEYDHILFITVLFLVGFGLVMVLSASHYSAMNSPGGMFSFLRTQAIAAAIGMVGMILLARGIGTKKNGHVYFSYEFLAAVSPILYIGANALLVIVLFVGDEVSGGTRWIQLPGFQFQPSELAKVAMILMLASYLAKDRKRADDWRGLLGCALIIGIPCALVALGRNMSTVIIIAAIGAAMVFLASSYFLPWIILGAGGVGGIIFMLATADNFRGGRFAAWIDPFSDEMRFGYHIIQSMYA
ncbi:MAG: FtsW/RodA/SpoVE family cell cycle protein, partial [Defluviitaleaceae bacterium]|nr:FtsW/RodA/SpoVE family cell cycle protein [Defluviitaleaceae bacterium]